MRAPPTPTGYAGGTCQTAYAEVGESCGPSISCEDSSCTDGVCTASPALGEACTDSCAFGYDCVDGTCAALPSAGAPCPSGQCRQGLACEQGTCVREPATGEPCTPHGPPCLWGFCDPATSTCSAYQAPLGPCTTSMQCQPVTDVSLCDLPPDGGVGHCVACDPIR